MTPKYMYIIAPDQGNKVKIGISDNPIKRLSQLQTGHPDKLILHHQYLISDNYLEKIIHHRNRFRKLVGEWFNMSVDQARVEIEIALIQLSEETDLKRKYKMGYIKNN